MPKRPTPSKRLAVLVPGFALAAMLFALPGLYSTSKARGGAHNHSTAPDSAENQRVPPSIDRITQIIAHRGASADAPENTLAAFRHAWGQDADGIECDVRLTADGQLVVIHDADTGRTGNGGGEKGTSLDIADHTLAELQAVDVGRWKSVDFAGETIPTLDGVLATVLPGKRVFIELKSGVEAVPELLAVIKRSKLALENISVISFDPAVVRAVKQASPEITANWLTYFERDRWLRWRPTHAQVFKTLTETGADGIGCKAQFGRVTPAFVQGLRRGGYGVHLWTIDDPADASRAHALGIDSITTNQPHLIRHALR